MLVKGERTGLGCCRYCVLVILVRTYRDRFVFELGSIDE